METEERKINNNVGVIRFIHSVVLEIAELKGHSLNFRSRSFHSEECWERQVHTRVKLGGEQLCQEGPGGVGRSQSGQHPEPEAEGGVHPTQIGIHRLKSEMLHPVLAPQNWE